MAGIKVFVSSTCYDLSMLRSELRDFILSMGYEPVMSDYMDVLYDPREHTHTSCIDEVSNCDMLIVIIGSRFGGKGVPESVSRIDINSLEELSKGKLPKDENLSITQLEVLKAIQDGIPVYTFIEQSVYSNHSVYEKNKDNPNVKDILFPAIEKQETAEFIFSFIDFIRLQSVGNPIFQFSRIQDIENTLKRQWASYFQKLLSEQKYRAAEEKRIDLLNNQLEDLKAAVLSSIGNANQKEIARSVIKYRRLTDFLFSLKYEINELAASDLSFDKLLNSKDIVKITDARELDLDRESRIYGRTLLVKSDHTFYDCRMPTDAILDLRNEWDSFKKLDKESKEIVLETLFDNQRSSMWLMHYHAEIIDKYLYKSPSILSDSDINVFDRYIKNLSNEDQL
jgi:hypothetical protein